VPLGLVSAVIPLKAPLFSALFTMLLVEHEIAAVIEIVVIASASATSWLSMTSASQVS